MQVLVRMRSQGKYDWRNEVHDLARLPMVGEYLAFGDRFERGVINQADYRSLEQSLEAGWEALRGLPRAELHRLSDAQIRAHLAG